MPELAEVERGRRLFENATLNRRIVEVSTQEDTRVFVDDSAATLEKSLPGRTITAVKRIGKNVYLELDGPGPTLAFHLGMTGSVAIKDGEFHYRRPRYIKRISASWPPWRWKILLRMEDDTEVCTIDTSRFGRIRAVDAEDAASVPPLSLLARDAWLDLPSHEELREELICRTAPIKTVLLDQNAAVAGLGNYNTDEILFQARIHPRQPAYTLKVEQSQALHSAIQLVAKTVILADADTKVFPKTWLYKHRYGRKDGVGQTFVMADGTRTQVTHDRINGRITALTHIQVLGDYSDVPLPKRRKHTKVESEGDEAESVQLDKEPQNARSDKAEATKTENKTSQKKRPLQSRSNATKKPPAPNESKKRRYSATVTPQPLSNGIQKRATRSSARLSEKYQRADAMARR